MATQPTKEELIAKATELGIQLEGTETNKEIAEAIKIKTEELAGANGGGDNGAGNGAGGEAPKAKKTKKYFYNVKVKSYINDTQTIEAGLYVTSEKIERLERSQKLYVEAYEDEIPEITLHKIAETYRVAIFTKDGRKARPYAEILEELAKVI